MCKEKDEEGGDFRRGSQNSGLVTGVGMPIPPKLQEKLGTFPCGVRRLRIGANPENLKFVNFGVRTEEELANHVFSEEDKFATINVQSGFVFCFLFSLFSFSLFELEPLNLRRSPGGKLF